MLKRMLLLAVVILCNTLVYGQKKEKIKGDRNVTAKETSINSFNKIVIGENFNVDIIVGSQASVFIETDDNLHDIIKFNVADSTLSFQTSKKITSSKKLSIKVVYTNTLKFIETIESGEISSLTSINLDDVELKNSGTSRAFLNIKSKNLKFTASNRARVKLNLTTSLANIVLSENSKLDMLINADSLQIDSYQQADAKIRGTLVKLKIRADNSSNVVAKDLTAKTCELLCEGSSDVAVQVTDSLSIDVSGSGEVYVYANPKIIINKFADTAKLYKKELKQ